MNRRLTVSLALLGTFAAAAFLVRPAPQRAAPPFAPPDQASASPRAASLTVYVAGAVKSPGVYSVPDGSRAIAAVKAAGGTTAAAQLAGVNLAERLEDGQEVLVPDDSTPPATRRGAARHGARGRHHHAKHRHHAQSADQALAPVDLNRGDAVALANVPGLSDALADRIVAFRALNGPFERLEDLLDVSGMNESKLDRAQPYLRVTAP